MEWPLRLAAIMAARADGTPYAFVAQEDEQKAKADWQATSRIIELTTKNKDFRECEQTRPMGSDSSHSRRKSFFISAHF